MSEVRQVEQQRLWYAGLAIALVDLPHFAAIEVLVTGQEYVAIRGDGGEPRWLGLAEIVRAHEVQRPVEPLREGGGGDAGDASAAGHAADVATRVGRHVVTPCQRQPHQCDQHALIARCRITEIAGGDPHRGVPIQHRVPARRWVGRGVGADEYQHAAR